MSDHGFRDLLEKVLRAERGLRGYRPSARRPPEEPPEAGRVLAALAAAHPPGAAIGMRQIIAAAGCTQAVATAVRTWAKSVPGMWPYADPPSLPAAWANKPRRKKGASS
jgi:hypothetical protein